MLTLRLCKKYIGYLLKTADGFPLLPEIKAKGRGIHEEAVSSKENKKTAIHLRKLDNRFPKGIFGADDETRTNPKFTSVEKRRAKAQILALFA